MRQSGDADDSARVDVPRTVPAAWLKVAILLANLAVWLEAAIRVAG
jgi:hypothetical protein